MRISCPREQLAFHEDRYTLMDKTAEGASCLLEIVLLSRVLFSNGQEYEI